MTPRKVEAEPQKAKWISKYGPWCAIVTIIISLTLSGLSFASNYGGQSANLNQVQEDITKIEDKNKDQDEQINESAQDIAAIKKSLEAIAELQKQILAAILNKGGAK
jgi:hypothetical protein